MNDLIIRKSLHEVIRTPNATVRITRSLKDGRMAILQVVNPEADPKLAKWLRKKAEKSKAVRVAHAMETANRVAGHVFRNIMRKER